MRLGDAVATQVHAVLHAAYMLEAAQIGCADFPRLRESVGDLKLCTDEFRIFRRGGEILGVLAFDVCGNVTTITRLAVHPAYLRRGIANALLDAFDRRVPSTACVNVSTAEVNAAAVSLY